MQTWRGFTCSSSTCLAVRVQQTDSSEPGREVIVLSLDSHIVRILREACGDENSMGAYLDVVIQQRLKAWRSSVRVLERTGWGQADIRLAEERLSGVLQLEFATASGLVKGLRVSGLLQLSRQLARNADLLAGLHAVLLELLAKNRSCARAVALMTPDTPTSWWRRVWR